MKRPRCTTCRLRMKGHKKQRCQKSSTVEYEDGSVYSGSTYNGRPSGVGTFQNTTGLVYNGHFVDGKRHGAGVEVGDKNYSYDGHWQSGMYHGKGRLVQANGHTYEGNFRNGRYHGRGSWVTPLQEYDGQWCNGTQDGQGQATSAKGTYTGLFRFGYRHGQGSSTTVDGVLYIGMWKRGNKCGHGISTSAEYTYTGEWSRNRRHGYGRCISPLHGVYVGHWYRDKRHGTGSNVYLNKTVYDGEWEAGEYNGRGTIQYADGSHYTGRWLDNDYHGDGQLTEGAITFTGCWKHGHRTGTFVEETAGQRWTGTYCNDVRHGSFTSATGKRLYLWGQLTVFPSVKKATRAVRNLLRSKDISAAVEVCRYVNNLVDWPFVYKHDTNGMLLSFVLEEELTIGRFQKYAWKLFQQQRFLFLEKMIDAIELDCSQGVLFDCISSSFVANPWMVRKQSYSESTKEKLLKGLHVGECGRCPPQDPFTRELLTESSGSYLFEDVNLAKTVYQQFIADMDSKPTVREIAQSFDMDELEEMLKNAQETNDRATIRRLLKERSRRRDTTGTAELEEQQKR